MRTGREKTLKRHVGGDPQRHRRELPVPRLSDRDASSVPRSAELRADEQSRVHTTRTTRRLQNKHRNTQMEKTAYLQRDGNSWPRAGSEATAHTGGRRGPRAGVSLFEETPGVRPADLLAHVQCVSQDPPAAVTESLCGHVDGVVPSLSGARLKLVGCKLFVAPGTSGNPRASRHREQPSHSTKDSKKQTCSFKAEGQDGKRNGASKEINVHSQVGNSDL